MNCSKIKELLYLYTTDDLTFRNKFKVKNHLSKCTKCTEELELIKSSLYLVTESLSKVPETYNADAMWQKVQIDIQSQYEIKRNKVINNWFDSAKILFFKLLFPPKRSVKISYAISLSIIVLLLLFFNFHKSGDKKLMTDENTIADSQLINYPVIEQVTDTDITVLTMQTDDPNIKVVWFFDKNFQLTE